MRYENASLRDLRPNMSRYLAIVLAHTNGDVKMSEKYRVPACFKVISGGQSGADRARLDWAIERNISHDGWCPKGRRSEEGAIDVRYQLSETPTIEVTR